MDEADAKHGESMYNVEGKIGGDSDLSAQGQEYSRALPDLIKKNIGDGILEVGQTHLNILTGRSGPRLCKEPSKPVLTYLSRRRLGSHSTS